MNKRKKQAIGWMIFWIVLTISPFINGFFFGFVVGQGLIYIVAGIISIYFVKICGGKNEKNNQ